MEINEKLDTFYQAAIDAATEQSAAMQREYEEWHRASIAEYEQGRQQEQRASGRIAQEQVRKEINRRTSEEMLRLKKEFHEQQELRKGELFALVEEKLADYRASDAYRELLQRKIEKAKELAQGEECLIYLDPEDAALKEALEHASGCTLAVSGEAFGGGIRAVVPGKHMMMDDSFGARLAEEREKFSF